MSEQPAQEPFEGMPSLPEAPKPMTEDEKIVHAELIATQAEAHPHEPTVDRPTRSEQEGGSVDLTAAQAAARAATKAARIAEAQAVLAAGAAKLKERDEAFAASKLTGPPAKPALQTDSPATTSTPPGSGEGAERLADALRQDRLQGVPAEHQLDTEAKTQAWIDDWNAQQGQKPETD